MSGWRIDLTLVERVTAGEERAAARLMRDLEDGLPAAREALRELTRRGGRRAHVVGLTGAPGAGKSSLAARLIARWRRDGRTVGVVAVDPTSSFTGGAILGDRIRMQQHATDPGVFIRSLATRGQLGGLSRATAEVVAVLEAMGKDVVLVETVGVGQDEIDVAGLADTVVVVAVPGLGDDVQAIKAGVLEIADVFAVNKADREGADRAAGDLRSMLELRRVTRDDRVGGPATDGLDGSQGSAPEPPGSGPAFWEPPIIKTVALSGAGVGDLADALERHLAHLVASGEREARQRGRARAGAPVAAGGATPAGPEAPGVGAPAGLRDPLLVELEARLGVTFAAPALALAALTHKSFVNEHRGAGLLDNERLEFLGDAVIDLAISHRLMERFPAAREGELSKLRAALVDETALSGVARAAGLGELLRLGRGEELTGGREKASLLADALEAVVAALYLGGGLPAVLGLVDRVFGDAFARADAGALDRDYKTQLQELAQSRHRLSPRYRVAAERGPDHEKVFEVEIELRGEVLGRGVGRSKKDAEQAAARMALERLAAEREVTPGGAA